MDNTELHYVTYDSEAIWDEMIATYVDCGGDVLYPGDEKEMLLRSVQADIVQVLAGVDNALRMQTLRYAVGEYLDLLGESRGCERISAAAATATVRIETLGGEGTTIPAGTTMTADGETYYALDDDLYIAAVEQNPVVSVTAVETGTTGNGLKSSMQLTLATQNPYVQSIVCVTTASGGMEEEDDDTYRERIRQYGMASVTTGPSSQYEAQAKAVSTQILDAKAINEGNGEVGIYLAFDYETLISEKEELIKAVEEALNDVNARPLTDKVTVNKATMVSYRLVIKVESDNSSSLLAKFAEAVEDYKEWQNYVIGRDFTPQRLVTALLYLGATSAEIVFDDENEDQSTMFKGDHVSYAEVSDTEYCTGVIELQYV